MTSPGRKNRPQPRGKPAMQMFRQFLAMGTLTALASALYFRLLPPWLPATLLGLSTVSFLQYAWDKSQARSGGWRTPETTLQFTALAGGWPGALLAQALLHHENAKSSFQVTFWFCVVVNVVGVIWLTAKLGN